MWYNGVFHLFFQDHVGGGVVGGHLASRDLVHWRRLPVAIWNDEWYDKGAIWTFSATIVDGSPVIVYPGIATPNASFDGEQRFTHAVALPANRSDPWLVDWVKPPYNPIVVGVNRDPSTAWQTAAGEWRYTDVERKIFSSLDFKNWTVTGLLDGFPKGECPDVFELPPSCAACAAMDETAPRPSHVHATVHYQLGSLFDGAARSAGQWRPFANWIDGVEPDPSELLMDGGDKDTFYAAKSFWDPVASRRILWGWLKTANVLEEAEGFRAGQCPGVGQVMTNTNSLPRVVTYDPHLQRLLFFPVPEMLQLRSAVLASEAGRHVKGAVRLLSSGAAQTEVRASFAIPSAAVRLGVSVMVGSGDIEAGGGAFETQIYVDFVPSAAGASKWRVDAGYDSSSMRCPDPRRVYLESVTESVPCAVKSAPLWLKATDDVIELAVWTDNTVVEAFFMAGRSAWAVPLPCAAIGAAATGGGGVSVFAEGGGADLLHAIVYAVDSIQYDG